MRSLFFFCLSLFISTFAAAGLQVTKNEESNFIRAKSVRAEILNPSQVIKAQRLLYDIYVEEVKWEPSTKNPSKLRIEENSEGKILTDDYMLTSTWIGAFSSENNLIGCMRFCYRHPNTKKLEVENYTDKIPSHITQLEVLFELTRGATNPLYRYKGLVLLKLLKKAFESIETVGGSVLATSPYAGIQRLLESLGPKNLGFEFKFEERDSTPVKIYLFEKLQMRQYIKIANMKIKKLESTRIHHKSNI